jgi:hypothetical protein
MEDHIFLFTMWNRRYFVIDKHSGQVLKKGNGDDVLREYGNLVPLRLTVLYVGPSMTYENRYPDSQQEKTRQDDWELKQDEIATFFIQDIPGSKLKKHYVVQFDPHLGTNGKTQRWQPLYVVVWKSEMESVFLNTNPLIAPIWINRHIVTPPTARSAIYSLQPDYSLQELPLSEEELTRLFLSITQKEEHAKDSLERHTFPQDFYWEQKIGPHLKVVEKMKKGKE